MCYESKVYNNDLFLSLCSVMLSSFEDGKPNLYMIDPSGVSYVCINHVY